MSEGIDRVSLGGSPNGLQEHRVIGDVDVRRKQLGDVLGDPDVVIQVDASRRVDLNQNVEIAVGARVAPSGRSEKRCALHALSAEGRFVSAQDRDDGISVHRAVVAANQGAGEKGASTARNDFGGRRSPPPPVPPLDRGRPRP